MTETCARCGLFHPAEAACLALSVPPPPGWDSPLVGTLLAGRYQLLQVIHRGGMSVLYLANDAFLPGQYVVLKELSFPDATPLEERREAESWFARESYLLSSLRNPLIPRFYSVFQEAWPQLYRTRVCSGREPRSGDSHPRSGARGSGDLVGNRAL